METKQYIVNTIQLGGFKNETSLGDGFGGETYPMGGFKSGMPRGSFLETCLVRMFWNTQMYSCCLILYYYPSPNCMEEYFYTAIIVKSSWVVVSKLKLSTGMVLKVKTFPVVISKDKHSGRCFDESP